MATDHHCSLWFYAIDISGQLRLSQHLALQETQEREVSICNTDVLKNLAVKLFQLSPTFGFWDVIITTITTISLVFATSIKKRKGCNTQLAKALLASTANMKKLLNRQIRACRHQSTGWVQAVSWTKQYGIHSVSGLTLHWGFLQVDIQIFYRIWEDASSGEMEMPRVSSP